MPEGRTDRGVLLLHEDSHGNDDVGLTLQFDNDTVERWSGSFWSCLQQIRVELEAREMKLVCYGTSRNVHPSGMQLGMGAGGMAYKLTMGKPARSDSVVSIFDTGDDVEPVSIAEQESFYRQWLKSLQRT